MNRKLIVAGTLAIIVGFGVLARRLIAAGKTKAIDEQLGSSDDFWPGSTTRTTMTPVPPS